MSTAEEPLTAGRDGLLSLLRHGQLPSRAAKAPQRERYQRIVAAAMELASEGGYDAVQMRAIADRAGVALGTVYRYFPSKNHVLAMGLLMVFEGMCARFEDVVIPGDTPSERILFVLRKNTEVLEKDRPRYEALVRAFMFADASASAELDAFGALMTEMFAKTVGVEKISDDQLKAIRVIGDVLDVEPGVVGGRPLSVDEVMLHLPLAVRLALRAGPCPPSVRGAQYRAVRYTERLDECDEVSLLVSKEIVWQCDGEGVQLVVQGRVHSRSREAPTRGAVRAGDRVMLARCWRRRVGGRRVPRLVQSPRIHGEIDHVTAAEHEATYWSNHTAADYRETRPR